MTEPSAEVAIVTVTYNGEDFIEDFLTATCAQLDHPSLITHLILVDNNSSDHTLQVAQDFIDRHGLQKRVTLVPQSENLGFGTGCNIGVEAAKKYNPKFYWFLNPDTQIFPDTGIELINFFRVREAADFVGSRLVDRDNVPRPSAFRFPSATSEFCRAIRLGFVDRLVPHGQIAMPVSNLPHSADWLTGASFMVKSEVFDQLGGFDPAFFLYFEEVDLFYRAKQNGFSCWFNPHSSVYHFAGASTGISSSRKSATRRPQYWFDSRRYFYCKNFSHFYFALCDIAAIAGLALWKLRLLLQHKDSRDPPGLLQDIAANSLFSFRADR
jgi:N-acetylglucosaminyl-diphospho-decaprenol L-rhamnosyltransferase